MISILAQERLLGFALGSACAGVAVFEQRRRVYESISSHDPHPLSVRHKDRVFYSDGWESTFPFSMGPPIIIGSLVFIADPIFGQNFRSEFKLIWNKAVDETFAPLVAAFGSRKQ